MHVYRQTMAGPRVCRLFVILEYLSLVLVLAQNPVEEKTIFEAAFQGESTFFPCVRGNFMNSSLLSTLVPLTTHYARCWNTRTGLCDSRSGRYYRKKRGWKRERKRERKRNYESGSERKIRAQKMARFRETFPCATAATINNETRVNIHVNGSVITLNYVALFCP